MKSKIVPIIFSTCLVLILGACPAGTKCEHPVTTAENNHSGGRKLVNIAAEDLISIEWMDQSGRKEVIQKEDQQWHYAGMEKVDSAAFNRYLNALVIIEGMEINDLKSTQGLNLLEKLTLYGNKMSAPLVITAFNNIDDEKPFLIHSSALNESVFISDSGGIYHHIFKDLRQFWPNGQ